MRTPDSGNVAAVSAPINSGASGAQVTLPGSAAPGFETLPYDSGAFNADAMDQGAMGEGAIDEGLGTPIGPDGWYDVDQNGNLGAGASASGTGTASDQNALTTLRSPAQSWNSPRNIIAYTIAILLLLAGVAGTIAPLRKRARSISNQNSDQRLTIGLRNSMASKMDPTPDRRPEMASDFVNNDDDDLSSDRDSQTAEPGLQPRAQLNEKPPQKAHGPADHTPAETDPINTAQVPPEDLRVDVAIEIISASRSIMMLTIDLRVDIANRSGSVLRDLLVAANLVCAQRAAGQAGTIEGAQTLELIERIGPHQSRRIGAKLQLPLSEVQAIRQGAKPLFIPLLHVMLDAGEHGLITNSFVIGTPSSASSGRVHPLPLDTPPGSMPALRGQLIKQPFSTDAAA